MSKNFLTKIIIDAIFLFVFLFIHRFWIEGIKELNFRFLKGDFNNIGFMAKRENLDRIVTLMFIGGILLMIFIFNVVF